MSINWAAYLGIYDVETLDGKERWCCICGKFTDTASWQQHAGTHVSEGKMVEEDGKFAPAPGVRYVTPNISPSASWSNPTRECKTCWGTGWLTTYKGNRVDCYNCNGTGIRP